MADAVFAAPSAAFTFMLEGCNMLAGNWWAAIFLFTLASKIVLLPLSAWVQRNYIVMLKLMPDVNRIKVDHFGDGESIGEKQNALYRERGYRPLLSTIPLIVQIVILLCLVNAVYSIAGSGREGSALLGVVPAQNGSVSLLVPVAAGLSALLLGWAQNRINPLQREQTRKEQVLVNGLSVALAAVLGLFVACGLGFYWICSNLLSIAVQVLMNAVIDPKKHVDYAALAQSRAELEKLERVGEGGSMAGLTWRARRKLAVREKRDYRRFFSVAGKHIVFYSEGDGFYKYFAGAIEWLLAHSDAVVHYVTNDPDDSVFQKAETMERLRPYYIGPKRAITFMMKMDADVVVSTLVDLDNYYIKRSYVRRDVFYAFMPHHMTSMHLVVPRAAFDHYDAVLCAGPHQVRELRRAEELRGLPRKEAVECGYGLLDADIAALEREHGKSRRSGGDVRASGRRPSVLVAPSWQEGNILDSCIDEVLGELTGRGWRVVVRPHPEYVKRRRAAWDALRARHAGHAEAAGALVFEDGFSSDETVFSADLLLTDWSSISCEYSFSTLRPCIFIDTPMKTRNPDWEELGIRPVDLAWRDELGVSFAPDGMAGLGERAEEMIENAQEWEKRIARLRDESIFNIGHADEVAGEYLLAKILERHKAREGGEAA